MNVLYISYDGVMDSLGASQIVPYVINLNRKGKKFTLLTYEKKENLSNINRIQKISKVLKENNVRWEILIYHKSPVMPATALDILLGFIKGFIIIVRDKINLVHARSFIGAIPGFFLSKLFSIKFIFDIRGLWVDEKVDAGTLKKNSFIYWAGRLFERIFLKQSDSVVILNNYAKIFLEDNSSLCNKVHIIPTCVDLNLFTMNKKNMLTTKEFYKNNRFVFVYLGSIGSWYLLKEMIDFFKVSRERFISPLFLLINKGNHRVVNSIMAKENISRSDYFMKSLDYQYVCEWLSLADASIFFIKPVFSKKFSCPTKFGESLACGIPVIINSGIGDTEEIVREERVGVVIDKFTDEAYRGAIKDLDALFSDRESLRQRCRFVAEKYFSLEDGIEKYNQVYNKLVEK